MVRLLSIGDQILKVLIFESFVVVHSLGFDQIVYIFIARIRALLSVCLHSRISTLLLIMVYVDVLNYIGLMGTSYRKFFRCLLFC